MGQLMLRRSCLASWLTWIWRPASTRRRPSSLNPFGQVPDDGTFTLADSNAILIYLASTYDARRNRWPADGRAQAALQRWLSVAADRWSGTGRSADCHPSSGRRTRSRRRSRANSSV
jgi:glutathione S-transferase